MQHRILLILSLCLSALYNISAFAAEPIIISNLPQLKSFRKAVNNNTDYAGVPNTDGFAGVEIKLTADIDLTGENWQPIGTAVNPFGGTFLGGGHTISNLTIEAPNSDNQGLFGYISDATIDQLNIVKINITAHDHVGGICGYAYNSSITNCTASGAINGNLNVGGICGKDHTDRAKTPTVVILEPTNVTHSDATLNATIKLCGASDIEKIGFAVSETNDFSSAPETEVELAALGDDNSFSLTLNTLKPSTTYYVRAFAQNAHGKSHSQAAQLNTTDVTISTPDELVAFREAVNNYENGVYKGISNSNNGFLGVTFRLTDDIDLSSVCHGGENEVSWVPIGGYVSAANDFPFQGTFKGSGHTISNLYINSNSNYQGLFGSIQNAAIDSLNVANTNIKGGSSVGGVCGEATYSTISNCLNSGTVNGTNDVGGVCGYIFNQSTISNCLNSGHVSGTGIRVGGVCGCNDTFSSISNCLNSGHVNGTLNYVGGVCGRKNNYGAIINCYYDNQMCPLAKAVGNDNNSGSGNSTAELTAADFNGLNSEHWTIAAGLYPRPAGVADKEAAIVAATPIFLRNNEKADNVRTNFTVGKENGVTWTSKQNKVHFVENSNEVYIIASGVDTLVCELENARKEIILNLTCEPTIDNLTDLQAFRDAVNDYQHGNYKGVSNGGNGFLNRSFRLTADIDLSSVCHGGENEVSWTPIGGHESGENSFPFQGTFKGRGYTISNLYINSTNDYQGLFGYIKNATIDGLNLANTNIKGDSRVGGVCGIAESSTFSNCFHSGSLKGGYSIGGVCGEAYNSTISNCLNTGHVNGTDNYVGGLCGIANSSNISNCIHSGHVNGTGNDVGGVCGYASGISNISNCLNTGHVSGTGNFVGGVCGFKESGTITNCYYDNQMCSLAQGIGIGTGEATGKATAELIGSQIFADNENWVFAENMYPRPTGVADKEAAIVAATPVLLANSETADAVQSAFSVGIENEVQWTSTTGLVSIDNNGECTFHQSGADTLVCRLGGVSKQVAIILAGDLTINNLEELQLFRNAVNDYQNGEYKGVPNGGNGFRNRSFRLTDNIDLSNVCNETQGNWVPIGEAILEGENYTFHFFQGTFKGGGYTISNLYINAESSDCQGLFGCINNATIDSLSLVNTHIKGNNRVGGVCGYIRTFSTISNCIHSGHVNGTTWVGGVCGEAYDYSTISNCLNSGIVDGAGNNVGGVCGYASNRSNISNCLNSGIVDGTGNNVGGVCGDASGISNISNCLNTGHVNGTDNYVGGVCGDAMEYSTISNCLNSGHVSGTGNVGGVCGNASSSTISNCLHTGHASGTSEYIGGVCGYKNSSTITNCYYDNQMCPLAKAVGNDNNSGSGNSTAELIGSQIFVGNENWVLAEDMYPRPAGVAEKEAAIVAATPVLLANSETADAVHSTFHVSIANEVEWLSKQGNVHIAEDGTCTILGGGLDTLVCMLGNARKEVPIVIISNTLTINNLTDLQNFRDAVNDYQNGVYKGIPNGGNGFRNRTFRLTANIDLSSVCHGGENEVSWVPIGGFVSEENNFPFQGTFKGGGHTISNLYINAESSNYQGLFGCIENATIDSLNVANTNIKGNYYVGGVCGYAYSFTISNCLNSGHVSGAGNVGGVCGYAYSSNISYCLNSGIVSGTGNHVGGVCGYAERSTISECLHSGHVSGLERVGGVCGLAYNNSTISNCLNSGHVSGEDYVGGVCGLKEGGTFTNCYYDNQMCPLADNGYGTGKSTSELIGFTTVFAGNANWNKQVGYYPCPKGLENSDAAKVARTPLLLLASDNVNTVHQGFQATDVNLWSSKLNKVDFSFEFPHIKDGGVDTLVCTYGNAVKEIPVVLYGPMHIENLDDLKAFRDAVNSNGSYKNLPSNGGFVGIDFYLDTDIDLNNENWTPIGTSTTNLNFKGNFHGQEHTISKLYIDASNNNYQGLFGYINNATVENLNITNSYIVGKNYVGGICGRAYGNSGIYNCTHSGIIVGTDYVGGICGYARELQWCLNSGIVRGSNYVGGVTGAKDSVGKFSDCINVACISGTSNSVGGVCGGNNSTGTFTNCYYDTRMCSLSRAGGINANNTDTRKGLATADLTNPNFDFALDENWTRTENMYPRPTEIATTDAAIVAATPVFLANGENFSAVRNDFTVGIGNGVTWSSKQGKVTFDNATGSATLDASGADTLVCTLGNAKKLVPITIYAPLFIDNSTDLSKFGYAVNNNGEYKGVANNGSGFAGYIIKLRNDILAESIEESIGTQARPFKGTFDGNGHTIRDLRLGANGNYKGLFGYIQNATVANVNLESLYISGNQYVGGICGYMEHSTIENCHVYNGEIEGIQGSSNVGGICGYSETTAHSESNHSSIINCTNSCTVTGEEYLGGICGTAAKRTLISGCKNRGIVDGHDDIGGICGTTTTYSTILGCANGGKISGNNRVGGVSGTADYAKINQNVNIGTVNGTADMTGGIVGKLRGDNVENSMNSGLVSGSNQVGGICGYLESSSSLKNCLNVSNTIGTSNIGSICGHNGRSSETTFANCYYDNQMYPLAQGIGSGVGTVYGIMTTGLIGSQIFADNENWTKTEGLYPVPTALADSDEAKVAATPAFLANNEKVDNVRANFTVGKENGVTWSSKQGKITFPENSNEAQIIASGVYTLVCELGDASKAVILNLTCERTIDNLTDLQNFRDAVNDYANGEYKGVSNGGNGFQGITFRLTADIEMNSQESWTPIGGYESVENSFPFQGTFKGGGYTISNLYIDAENNDYQGLFGCINNATIDSLSLVNTHIKGNNRVGGVCGDAFNNSNISNCLNSGIVSGTGNVGGVCGCNDTFSSISNCLNNGHVNGTGNNIGGVCGYTVASIISNCLNSGHVIGTNSYVGGVCGDATYSTISNCLNSGTVNGTNDVGGVCGIAYYNSTISNCYYDNQMCPLAKAVGNDNNSGSGNSTAELIGSQIFVGNENWVFAENMYPRPAGVADKEAAIVAATPIFLKNNEKVNNVRTNFTVSTENGVTWTSKNHLVTIDNATGECTFTYGGLDTLVCELGNAMKEIPLVLYGILTINNLEELQLFRDAVNDYQHGNYKGISNGNNGFLGITFRLTADIDLSSVCHGGENEVSWVPIGGYYDFKGTFKGDGHTISNLYIDAESSDYQGLFGYIKNATIDSLILANTNIKGRDRVGGVCGYTNASTISNCLHSGHVNGTGNDVGGVCGYTNASTISNCLHSGHVNGTGNHVGGVCGYTIASTISNCLNTGHVSENGRVGSICGYKEGGTLTNCYYDNQMCPLAQGIGFGTGEATGKATAELTAADFNGLNSEHWTIAAGLYPRPAGVADHDAAIVAATPIILATGETVDAVQSTFSVGVENEVQWESTTGLVSINDATGECTFSEGGIDTLVCRLGGVSKRVAIILAGDLTINNLEELQLFRNAVNDYENGNYKGVSNGNNGFLNRTFRLTADIDLSSVCHGGENEVSWVPIGGFVSEENNFPFQGTFKGGGHTISNLYINAESSNYQGLFGCIENATIDSLNVANTNIKGGYRVGGVCGYAVISTISNCIHNGNVNGTGNQVGGVCGYAFNNSTISDCLNSGIVSGTGNHVGGVCGAAISSTISNCLNSGHVNGTGNYVGGVCGEAYNNSNISNCLNSGHVSGAGDIGGVCGYASGISNISNCLNTGHVNGTDNYVGGVCGNAYSSTISNCLNSGHVSGAGDIGGVCGYNDSEYSSTITNCYYDNQMCPLAQGIGFGTGEATGKATAELIGSQIFVGNENWVFAENMYPRPAGVADHDAAIVAATPVLLASGETTSNVRTNFTVGKENNVTWTSKQGKITFQANSNEAHIIASGVDTLVCELENARKEIILNLTCEPTIDNLTDLQNFRDAVNDYENGEYKGIKNIDGFSGVTFRLTDDIDLSSVCHGGENEVNWVPIGRNGHTFQGTFKGGGYTISNLYINAESSACQGLFGRIDNATIDSLILANTNIKGRNRVGGVCGYAYSSTVSDCLHSGTVNGTSNNVGGVCGAAISSTISNCLNSGHVIGTNSYVGGVCGDANSSNISNCLNSGIVDGAGNNVGGVCGDASNRSNISNCLNSGHVIGTNSYVGGVCGDANSSNISNCLNSGIVDGAGNNVGGVCGDASGISTISNCLNTGHVSGTGNFVGGVCGFKESGTITNCYYDNQMCSLAQGIGIGTGEATGKATAELTAADFNGLNSEHWTIAAGLYPRPAGVADHDAAIVAATPIFLATGETVDAVQSAFSVGVENEVQWESTTGLVSINDATGECTFSEGGIDTLVCRLGGVSKQVAIILAGDLTINNLEELQLFRNAVNDYQHGNYKGISNGNNGFRNRSFRLTADIDLSSVCNETQGSWVPIGEAILEGENYTLHSFQGTFKGDGHTISNLYIDAESSNYQGLFGDIKNATIDSLNVANTNIKGNNYVGGVCGFAVASNISNCLNSGIVDGASNNVGGVCGNANSSSISNCLNSGTVSGTIYVGGVCGYVSSSTISNCLNSGHVSGAGDIGGVCGFKESGTITNCYYDNQMCPLAQGIGFGYGQATGKATAELTAADFNGFDSEHWTIAAGLYPRPAGVADHDAAIVAATPIILATGETVDAVQSTFSVGVENEVQWTSTTGLVSINNATGECTILGSGVDTLVCTLGNARKEVPIKLFVP